MSGLTFLLKTSTRIGYMLVGQVSLYDAQQLEKAEQEALATELIEIVVC